MKKECCVAVLFILLGCTSTQQESAQVVDIVTVSAEEEGQTRITYQAFNRLYTVYVHDVACHYQSGKSTLNDEQVQPNSVCK